jgi:hypothetical protein
VDQTERVTRRSIACLEGNALGIPDLGKIRWAVQLRSNSAVPPGAQLHVLAIGVGDYNAAHAKRPRLEFDTDVTSVVMTDMTFMQQRSPYRKT